MKPRHIFLAFVLFRVTAGLAQKPAPAAIPAGLSVGRIFGDPMVLQREIPVKVWGWAGKGEVVTVSFAGQTKTASAGDDRSWMVQHVGEAAMRVPQGER